MQNGQSVEYSRKGNLVEGDTESVVIDNDDSEVLLVVVKPIGFT